jgi:hypothetical protein
VSNLDNLQDSLSTWELLTLLLDEVADLLSGVHVDNTSMSTLDDVIIIWNAKAMLPIVGIGIGQLIVLASSLIRDIEHTLVVCYHLVLLEPKCYNLRIVRVELSQSLKVCFRYNSSSLVGINNQSSAIWHSSHGKDT